MNCDCVNCPLFETWAHLNLESMGFSWNVNFPSMIIVIVLTISASRREKPNGQVPGSILTILNKTFVHLILASRIRRRFEQVFHESQPWKQSFQHKFFPFYFILHSSVSKHLLFIISLSSCWWDLHVDLRNHQWLEAHAKPVPLRLRLFSKCWLSIQGWLGEHHNYRVSIRELYIKLRNRWQCRETENLQFEVTGTCFGKFCSQR
jgi:hypothetical protein